MSEKLTPDPGSYRPAEKEKLKRIVFPIVLFGSVFTAIVVASGLGWNPFRASWNFTNPGAFGDSFGPLSAIMASIAAVAAVAAYQAQAKELQESRVRQKEQQRSADRRDFETTFFNLLELLRETVKEICVPDQYHQNPVSGKDGLTRIYDFIGGEALSGDADASAAAFRKFHGRFRDDLAHYFRLVYHILKFVHESEVDQKRRYIGIFRATLSEGELGLIALNCMYGSGKRKLKPLVEQYALLHNISDWSAAHWNMLDLMKADAFGDRDIRKAVERVKERGVSEDDQLD